MADAAAVADGVEEAAVAGVTRVAAGQRVTETRLLVRDAATRRAHGPTLQLQRCRRVLTTQTHCESELHIRPRPSYIRPHPPHIKSHPPHVRPHPPRHTSPTGSDPPQSRQVRGRGHVQRRGRGFSLHDKPNINICVCSSDNCLYGH